MTGSDAIRLAEDITGLVSLARIDERLKAFLVAAIDLLGADMGTVQLLDREGGTLRLVAHVGLDRAFVDTFREVREAENTTCGRALRTRRRVAVQDVEADPLLAPYLPALRAAGIRGMQSTPLLRRDGRPAGVMSTYFRAPRRLSELEARVLDVHTRLAMDLVDLREAAGRDAERMRMALDAARAGFWERRIDTGEAILSPRALALHGLPQGAQLTYQTARRTILPEDRPALDAMTKRAIETGEPIRIEYRCAMPDGSIRWIEAQGERSTIRGYPCIIGVVRDITARNQAREQMRASRVMLESALASMSDAIFICDAEARLVLFNDAYATYYRFPDKAACPKELSEYLSFLEVLQPNGEPEPPEQWPVHRALRGEAATDQEHWVRRKDTGETWLGTYNLAPIRDAGGSIVGCVVVARDITEQRQTELELRQAQKLEAVAAVTGGMAHDFNNLLSVITLNLGFVLRTLGGTDTSRPMLQEAKRAAERGADLIRSLLAFARRQPLQPSRVVVNDFVAATGHLMSRVLRQDIGVTIHLAPDLWPSMVDPAQLEASLMNLATNARDAMPTGGEITVGTANLALDAPLDTANGAVAPAGDYVEIAMSDTGRGMAPDVLERAFDPFFTTKGPDRGSGLGLSSVLGFVQQSGGYVVAESKPGQGTTMRLLLPRAVCEPAAEMNGRAVSAPTMPGKGEVVLVVEDNASLRHAVTEQLRDLGYRTIEAAAAEEALAVLGTTRVDLVFSDVVMPGGMSGFGLARAIRERGLPSRVLLTTGYADEDAEFAAQVRHEKVLRKPYDTDALAAAIGGALRDEVRPPANA